MDVVSGSVGSWEWSENVFGGVCEGDGGYEYVCAEDAGVVEDDEEVEGEAVDLGVVEESGEVGLEIGGSII